MQYGDVAWGDYDNDGDLDIILSGNTLSGSISKIYRNDSDVFTDINAGLVYSGSVAWGDYDNDGDLDVLLTESGIAKIYRNNSMIKNTVPVVPENLSLDMYGSEITFSWNKATDNETLQDGLSYNIGLTIDGINVTSAMADSSSGYREIVAIGNVSQNNFYKSTNILLPQEEPKAISWRVQAIDHCFAGSEFASVDTILYSNQLMIYSKDEMYSTDVLTWEIHFHDSINYYELQIDESLNFISPLSENISLSKKKNNKGFSIALNELANFDSLVTNETYYWRIKPIYTNLDRITLFSEIPLSFIFNPTYSAPSLVNIELSGDFVTISWNTTKELEKGEVYNVYSTDDPYAVFPIGWTLEATVYTNEWTIKTSELKKFYCVTSASGGKEEDEVEETPKTLK